VTRATLAIAALLLAACTGGSSSLGDAGGSPNDGGGPDTSECEWGTCVQDCFGGTSCVAGQIWQHEFREFDCCEVDIHDPLVCALAVIHECATPVCQIPDPRYQYCVAVFRHPDDVPDDRFLELLALQCPEASTKVAGASCATDADCRPAADGAARLRCDIPDAGVGTCVAETRPAPNARYGTDCGLPPDLVPFGNEGRVRTDDPACRWCQVARAPGGCLRQACTMDCILDEDCPEGSICLCGFERAFGYCAPATGRELPADRAAGLPACP
jgi:hypothetical protein